MGATRNPRQSVERSARGPTPAAKFDLPSLELVGSREFAVQNQIAGFLERRAGDEIFNGVTTIEEAALGTVDLADPSVTGNKTL